MSFELHATQGVLHTTGHALAHEEQAADTLADGFREISQRAAGEQAGRRQAEQVLSEAVSGTIQWLDQVKDSLSALQGQLAEAPTTLTDRSALGCTLSQQVQQAHEEASKRPVRQCDSPSRRPLAERVRNELTAIRASRDNCSTNSVGDENGRPSQGFGVRNCRVRALRAQIGLPLDERPYVTMSDNELYNRYVHIHER